MKKQYWSLSKSIEEAGKLGIEVSRPTLIKWIHEYKLGFQLGGKGGKWYIYPQRLMRYIHGGKASTSFTQGGTIGQNIRTDEDQGAAKVGSPAGAVET